MSIFRRKSIANGYLPSQQYTSRRSREFYQIQESQKQKQISYEKLFSRILLTSVSNFKEKVIFQDYDFGKILEILYL